MKYLNLLILVVLMFSFFSYSADRPESYDDYNKLSNSTSLNHSAYNIEAFFPIDQHLIETLCDDFDDNMLFGGGDGENDSDLEVVLSPPHSKHSLFSNNEPEYTVLLPTQDQIGDSTTTPPSSSSCCQYNGSVFECPSCISEKQLSEISILDCYCLICRKCLIRYIESADRDTMADLSGLPCPFCRKIVSLNMIRQVAGKKQYKRINKIIESIISSSENYIQCPIKTCLTIMYIDEINTHIKENCVKCKASLCVHCKVSPYHDSITCDEFRQKQITSVNNELPDNIFLCPKCGAYIELIEGCNKVKCTSCKNYLCAECKKQIYNNYSHFKEGVCALRNHKIPQPKWQDYCFSAPNFGTFPNNVEKPWLAKHLKYRPDNHITVFKGGKCYKCKNKNNFMPFVYWNCGHEFCYNCGSHMFDNNIEWEKLITYCCINCLQQEIDQTEFLESHGTISHRGNRMSMPSCNSCGHLPIISYNIHYCIQCINKIIPKTEGEAEAEAEGEGEGEGGAIRPMNQLEFQCELCQRLITYDDNYCKECCQTIEKSMNM